MPVTASPIWMPMPTLQRAAGSRACSRHRPRSSMPRPAASALAAAAGSAQRRAEQRQEAVAQELVDEAVVAVDDLDHLGKEVVQQRHRLVGRARARHGGEAADVEEQHADRAHLARRSSAPSSRSTTAGETCWPNRLVTRSRAAAAATEFSNCWRRLPGDDRRRDAGQHQHALRLRW